MFQRNKGKLRPITTSELSNVKTNKLLRSTITLASQYQSYATCVEFAKKWFVDKFSPNYFNSIYVHGAHSFDEFRKFSDINQQLKRSNPLLAIIPTIDPEHNRNWIDTRPEMPLLLRQSRVDNSFLRDASKGLYMQIIFKTILMNFTYKVRLDTKALQLDVAEYIKLHHRAGFTQTVGLDLDIHVPKSIIRQIAFDNGFIITDNGEIQNPIELLSYLNSHSLIPFLYKLRCSTGNKEFFIKVPNCQVHIKTSMPSLDDGDRQEMITTNFNIDLAVEMEMHAPYCFTYYSQHEHGYISDSPINDKDATIAIMAAIMTKLPPIDCNGWDKLTVTEYDVEDSELHKPIIIDFNDFFSTGDDLYKVIKYTKLINVSPSIFLNFLIYNDGISVKYSMDWETMKCYIDYPITNCRTVIGVYCDNKYLNETLIYLKNLDINTSRID